MIKYLTHQGGIIYICIPNIRASKYNENDRSEGKTAIQQ